MQTFLPYSDYVASARVLDRQRLGKQRVEAWQIYQALINPDYGWQNHPAVKMWRGYERSLLVYGAIMCHVWINRGYKDTMKSRFRDAMSLVQTPNPPWLGDKQFHESHQSNLLRKDYNHYKQYFPDIPDNLPYVWPGESK